MLPNFQNVTFLKKPWMIPHENCHFLLNMDFLAKEKKSDPQIFHEKRSAPYLPNGVKRG
jgi:hypothetical protein